MAATPKCFIANRASPPVASSIGPDQRRLRRRVGCPFAVNSDCIDVPLPDAMSRATEPKNGAGVVDVGTESVEREIAEAVDDRLATVGLCVLHYMWVASTTA